MYSPYFGSSSATDALSAMMNESGRKALDKLRIKQGLDPGQPWGGRSPRAVIQEGVDRRIESVRFRRETAPSDESGDELLDEQYRRWLSDETIHEGS